MASPLLELPAASPPFEIFAIQGRGDSTRSRLLRGTCLVRQEGDTARPPPLPSFLIFVSSQNTLCLCRHIYYCKATLSLLQEAYPSSIA